MALQSKTITGSTNNSNWTHKIVVTENSTSITGNTSSVTVTAYIGRASTSGYMYGASISDRITVTGASAQTISYSNSGTVTIAGGGWLNIGSKTFTVPHNNDGTKTITIGSSFSNNVSPSSGSASGSMTLTRINRYPVLNSGTNFTDEGNPTLTFSNPSKIYPIRVKIEAGGNTQLITRDIGKTATSYTFDLTETERNTLRALCPNSNTLNVVETVCAMNGNTELSASYKTYTMSIVNANPIFTSDIECVDMGGEALIDNITTNLTGDDSVVINGYSSLGVVIESDAVAQKGASISYYQIENQKLTFEEGDIKSTVIEKYNKNTISVYAVDSRSNSTLITKEITNFINYFDIIGGSISLTRNDNGISEFVTLKYNGTFWNGNFGARNNTLVATYKFKKTTDTNYTVGTTTITPTALDNSFSFEGLIAGDTTNQGFDRDEIYEVIVEINDCLSKITLSGLINAGSPAIAVYGNKAAIGNKYDTQLGGTQLWGDIYLNEGDIVNYSTNELKTEKKWIDGKPIYKKVINVGAFNNNTEIHVATGLSNVNVLNLFGFANISTGVLPINFANVAESKYIYTYYHSSNYLRIRTNLNPITECCVILEYTKTTD